jgi:hypothetical protein
MFPRMIVARINAGGATTCRKVPDTDTKIAGRAPLHIMYPHVSALRVYQFEGQAPRVDGFGREFASERAQCLRTGRYQILQAAPPVVAEISPAIASSLATMWV